MFIHLSIHLYVRMLVLLDHQTDLTRIWRWFPKFQTPQFYFHPKRPSPRLIKSTTDFIVPLLTDSIPPFSFLLFLPISPQISFRSVQWVKKTKKWTYRRMDEHVPVSVKMNDIHRPTFASRHLLRFWSTLDSASFLSSRKPASPQKIISNALLYMLNLSVYYSCES